MPLTEEQREQLVQLYIKDIELGVVVADAHKVKSAAVKDQTEHSKKIVIFEQYNKVGPDEAADVFDVAIERSGYKDHPLLQAVAGVAAAGGATIEEQIAAMVKALEMAGFDVDDTDIKYVDLT